MAYKQLWWVRWEAMTGNKPDPYICKGTVKNGSAVSTISGSTLRDDAVKINSQQFRKRPK
jgi:hypothetical protein